MAWDFNSALSDPLVTVVDRMDDWGTFKIQIGTIPTIISIVLGRHMTTDETKVWVSHAIHTPVQAGPYRTSQPYWDDPEYALKRTVSGLTDYYRQATEGGHIPAASWLVDY
jgi:hypothetical protein